MSYYSPQQTTFDQLGITLLITGGINWGLIGLFHFDLIAFIFGPLTILTRLAYVLIGLSAVYSLYSNAKISETARPRLA
jgi:uncharacterized membrane protein YuzA (DUF378 family)